MYFPKDILLQIIEYLRPFDISNLSLTYKTLHTDIDEKMKDLYFTQTYKELYTNFRAMLKFLWSLRVFNKVDVYDTTGVWCEAVIIGHQIYKNSVQIKVKYLGYSSRWNEWMKADNGRVVPYSTKCYNGFNEPVLGNRVLYYYRHKWRTFTFLGYENSENDSNETFRKIVLQKKSDEPPIVASYIKDYIAPISRRGILIM